MEEEPNPGQNPFASLSTQDALRRLSELDNEIALVERQGAIATQPFIDLLQTRRQLCEVLKKLNEMNNCETRIRFLEARMRGDVPVMAEVVSLDLVRRRKKKHPMIVLGVTFAAAMFMMLASIPIIKSAIGAKQNAARADYADGPVRTGVQGTVVELNENDPGRTFDINRYLKSGQTSVFYFHSDDCPPCEALMPQYVAIAQQCPDVRFYTLDIDRPGTQGIDFDSPLARQYHLNSIPHLMVYDGYHKTASGREAFDKLNEFANASP